MAKEPISVSWLCVPDEPDAVGLVNRPVHSFAKLTCCQIAPFSLPVDCYHLPLQLPTLAAVGGKHPRPELAAATLAIAKSAQIRRFPPRKISCSPDRTAANWRYQRAIELENEALREVICKARSFMATEAAQYR